MSKIKWNKILRKEILEEMKIKFVSLIPVDTFYVHGKYIGITYWYYYYCI